jgi:hypothetical protein
MALADAAGCPPAQERHRLDCLVRWLREHGWAGAQSLGGAAPLTICAGIGTLTIGPEGETWLPAIPATRATPPLPAPDDLRTARLAACSTCDRFITRCTIAGCSCAGLGKPERLLSRCPLGRWPSPEHVLGL